MFNKIRDWVSDNKDALIYGAYCGACCVYGIGLGVYCGKRIVAKQLMNACHMGQEFHYDATDIGTRYLFKFGTEAIK